MKCSRLIVRAIVVAVVLVSFGLQIGCETTGAKPQMVGGGDTMASPRDIRVNTTYSPGDKLTLDFDTGLPTPWQQVVREDGFITLPLNKAVLAAGKRKGELEDEIREIYVPNTLRRLTVNVRSEDRTYFVQGEVRTPGQRPHTGLITAMKAIAAAGDFTDFAKKTDIEIIRANGEKIKMNGKKALKNPALDVPVYPGDTVHVHRRYF